MSLNHSEHSGLLKQNEHEKRMAITETVANQIMALVKQDAHAQLNTMYINNIQELINKEFERLYEVQEGFEKSIQDIPVDPSHRLYPKMVQGHKNLHSSFISMDVLVDSIKNISNQSGINTNEILKTIEDERKRIRTYIEQK